MTKELQIKILSLYPEFHKVYGPYTRKDNRKVVILYDGKKRSARQYGKVLLEVQLQRRLTKDEEVDHENEICSDDTITNLQTLTPAENRRKSIRHILGDKRQANCIVCKNEFWPRINKNKTLGKYCSNKCRYEGNRLKIHSTHPTK